MNGGGIIIFVKPNLKPILLANNHAANDAYNILAVKLLGTESPTCVVSVYRAPWAMAADSKALFCELEVLAFDVANVVYVGDFNIPEAEILLSSDNISSSSSNLGQLQSFIDYNNLILITKEPSRGKAFLDLAMVTPSLSSSTILQLPPFGGSDHQAQVISIPARTAYQPQSVTTKNTSFNKMLRLLSFIDWSATFSGCTDVDDYVAIFMSELDAAFTESTVVYQKKLRKRECLPKFILKLIRQKNAEWRRAQITGDRSAYHAARNLFRTVLSGWRADYERRLSCNRDKRNFYRYINKRLGRCSPSLTLVQDADKVVHGAAAAELLSKQFASNFTPKSNAAPQLLASDSDGLLLTCSIDDVIRAIRSSSNSAAGQDGYSNQMIKLLEPSIKYPLLVIFQQSLYNGKFPWAWKEAKIFPLYKGKGDTLHTGSYRPISMCSCLGKLLEHIVKDQLVTYISEKRPLSNAQHGFISGRSTVTNILSCDALITKLENRNANYDIVAFDFKKAFDKVAHDKLLYSLSCLSMNRSSLKWFESFLSDRTQRVCVDHEYSSPVPVESGLIQGSTLGPVLFTLFIDSLLKIIPVPIFAYADDITLVAEIKSNNQGEVQKAIDLIGQWSVDNTMPLSFEKCSVLHCGLHNPKCHYSLLGQQLSERDTMLDLGVTRSANCDYQQHHPSLVARG